MAVAASASLYPGVPCGCRRARHRASASLRPGVLCACCRARPRCAALPPRCIPACSSRGVGEAGAGGAARHGPGKAQGGGEAAGKDGGSGPGGGPGAAEGRPDHRPQEGPRDPAAEAEEEPGGGHPHEDRARGGDEGQQQPAQEAGRGEGAAGGRRQEGQSQESSALSRAPEGAPGGSGTPPCCRSRALDFLQMEQGVWGWGKVGPVMSMSMLSLCCNCL